MSEVMARSPAAGGYSGAARLDREEGPAEWLARNLARGRHELFTEILTITPGQARALLELNQGNRRITKASLARWQRAMAAGLWVQNGETLKVASNGMLNDGQHRLEAVVATNRPAPAIIVWGVDRDAILTTDIGKVRAPGDTLTMAGYTNGTAKAAAMRLILNLEFKHDLSRKWENGEIRAACDVAPNLDDSINPGQVVGRHYRQPPSLMTALHYMAARYDRPMADAFFHALATGGHDETDHPIRKLRTRLHDNMAAKAKLPQPEVAALVIKAFNAYALGRPMQLLRWSHTGVIGEPFPQFLSRPAPKPRR